jgi:hypothetical protein
VTDTCSMYDNQEEPGQVGHANLCDTLRCVHHATRQTIATDVTQVPVYARIAWLSGDCNCHHTCCCTANNRRCTRHAMPHAMYHATLHPAYNRPDTQSIAALPMLVGCCCMQMGCRRYAQPPAECSPGNKPCSSTLGQWHSSEGTSQTSQTPLQLTHHIQQSHTST